MIDETNGAEPVDTNAGTVTEPTEAKSPFDKKGFEALVELMKGHSKRATPEQIEDAKRAHIDTLNQIYGYLQFALPGDPPTLFGDGPKAKFLRAIRLSISMSREHDWEGTYNEKHDKIEAAAGV